MTTPSPLRTVAALEALWTRVRERPLWAPPSFFRYLRLRRQASLTLLDPARVRVLAPRGMVNDCAACRDNCCIGKRSTVLLHLCDLAALVDVGRSELVTQARPSFTPEELAARPALRRQVESSAWRAFPVLAQNRFYACRALDDGGRCTLHPHWPLSCARFPYALRVDELQVFYSRRCDAFWVHNDGRADAQAEAMRLAAVAAYNERIKDLVLLAYARDELGELGLLRFLAPPHGYAEVTG